MFAKLGPLVSQVAGSIGGTTFQRGNGGTVIRSKPLPKPRTSRASSTARQRAKTLLDLWRTFSPTERSDWDIFAGTVSWTNRFGDPVAGSGYKAFLRCNMASYTNPAGNGAKAIQLTPPPSTDAVLPAAPLFVYDLATDKLQLQSSDGTTNAKTVLALLAGPPTSGGRSSWHRPVKYLDSIGPLKPLPYDLTTAYTAVFGRLPNKLVREQAFLRVQAYNELYMWPGLDVILPLTYV